MIARQTNEYFSQNTENNYVDAEKYENGVYYTDNFAKYTIDLNEYANQEVYLRIVDNDRDIYYGYISVDDIRVGYNDPQEEGQYYVKTHQYAEDCEAIDEYHIKNYDFEIGSLAGWTIVSGDAFSHDGVTSETMWWNENLPYNHDGKYHFGYYNPTGVGVLRSSVFKLGGAGFVSFKLGGCQRQDLTYIRFMMVEDGNPIEVARVSNEQFSTEQFPYIPMKLHSINLVQYYVDLSEFVGKYLYLEMVDNNTGGNDEGCMVFDTFETYYTSTPYWTDKEYYKIDITTSYEREVESEYQVKNGTFETGDLAHWTKSWSNDNDKIGRISSKSYWWGNANLPFNKKGTYFFSGEEDEAGRGTLTSSAFTVGGSGYMTFRMSGGRDPLSCYISILDASTDEELLRFANFMFNDFPNDPDYYATHTGRGSNLMNMILYKADLSSLLGRSVKIQVVDNASSNWGLICVDSFITYYEDASQIDSTAIYNPNTLAYREVASQYQVTNGSFETGDASGWTFSDNDNPIMGISRDYTWWFECFLYNHGGSYHMDGWAGGEANTGTMTSSAFELGGTGIITYKLGGGKDKNACYIEFVDADTDEVLAKTYNQKYKDFNDDGMKFYYAGYPTDLGEKGYSLGNMIDYKIDLSAYLGHNIKIRVVDNATAGWGVVFVDEFVTYYDNINKVPTNCITAELLNA